MNVRDPFSLRQPNALSILRGTASRAATNFAQQALVTSVSAIEAGRQVVQEAVEDMSTFSIPKNVPSFSNPQRELENRAWGSSGVTARTNSYGGGFFEKSNHLPMYKDKPFAYAKSRRAKPLWRKRRLWGLVGAFVMFILYLRGQFSNETNIIRAKTTMTWLKGADTTGGKVDWLKRREMVVDAFTLSWDAYDRYAWGYDEYHPIAKTGKNMTPKGMGWIIVDSLDTLMLMNLTSRLGKARKWLSTLDYEQDQEVNTFETTIRMLGGLLSAHYLSTTFPDMAPISEDDPGSAGEDLYLEKAKDLADRIMGAFESNSGVPYASFNLKTLEGIPSHADGGASSTAEATTLQLEFKYLSKLTGEDYYWQKVEKVMQVVDDQGAQDGLVPIYIYAENGNFRGDNIRLGSRGDSYYEYLIKQYLQTSKKEPVYLEMWDEAIAGVRKHLITYSTPSGFTVLGERPQGLNGMLSPKMDHLVCFMPGAIALGATGGLTEKEARKLTSWGMKQSMDMVLARELTQTCWGMYKQMATGLAPEITHFKINNPPKEESAPHHPPSVFDESEDAAWRSDFEVKAMDRHNLQRPETAESLFYMWRITGDEMYREWGWEMFTSFMNHSAVEEGGGFTSLINADVVPPATKDNMESFWLAETLKYFFLLFSPDDLLPLDEIVINTEAHPLPRFEMPAHIKTGWARKPRDKFGQIVQPVVPDTVQVAGNLAKKVKEEAVEIKTVVVGSDGTITT